MAIRVLITGIGLVTPLGLNTATSWRALLASHSGVVPLTTPESATLPVRIAAQLADTLPEFPDSPLSPTPKFGLYALHAADEALRDAGFNGAPLGTAGGVSIGVGISGLEDAFSGHDLVQAGKPRRVSPYLVPRILINTPASLISLTNGLKGPCLAPSTACAAGMHAISEAMHCVKRGEASVMLAGGSECAIHGVSIAAFSRARALATGWEGDPSSASRPFDAQRSGFVLGEGGAVLVLESSEHARARGCTHAYAELVGSAATADAFHVTAPCPEGLGARRAMKLALERGGLRMEDVDYVNAHATGTRVGDQVERRAIAHVLRSNKSAVVSATKGATGHLLGGAGAMETAFTALAVSTGRVPPTLNLEQLDEDAEAERNGWGDIKRYVPLRAHEKRIDAALCNSFGFGGTNACLALRTAAGSGFARREVSVA